MNYVLSQKMKPTNPRFHGRDHCGNQQGYYHHPKRFQRIQMHAISNWLKSPYEEPSLYPNCHYTLRRVHET